MIGLTMSDVTHPDDQSPNDHLLSLIRDTHEPFKIMKRYIANERPVWVENHVSWLGTGAEGRIMVLSHQLDGAEIPGLVGEGIRPPLNIAIASYVRDMSGQLAEVADAGGLPTTAGALRLIDKLAFEEIEDALSTVGPV